MPDLALGASRPYSLVTTVVHRGPAQVCRMQLDIHLASADLRIRFLDRDTILGVCHALTELMEEAYFPDPRDYRPVRTRVYTDQDQPQGPKERSFLFDLSS